MSKPKPARYRTANWSTYNDALRKRGSLLIWVDKAMACAHSPSNRTDSNCESSKVGVVRQRQ
jgi:hypothetical protein